MSNIDDMVPSASNFLKKEDVGEHGVDLTIAAFTPTTVGQGSQAEDKCVIEWREQGWKPMVLNPTNRDRLKMIFKTVETNDMIGRPVNVYNDIMVSYNNQQGGLRLRPAQSASQAQRPPAQPTQPPPQTPGNPNWQPTPPGNAYKDEDVPW